MNIEVTIIKDIPKDKVKTFEDKVVYEIARETLDRTAGFFPRLTGDLEIGSYAMGVVGSNKEYGIGSEARNSRGEYYAKYVWKYPQNTNWTNPATLAQWYTTVFGNHAEQITNSAITKTRSIL